LLFFLFLFQSYPTEHQDISGEKKTDPHKKKKKIVRQRKGVQVKSKENVGYKEKPEINYPPPSNTPSNHQIRLA